MGGNALKNTYTRRYKKEEYDVLTSYVLATLDCKCQEIPSYKNKDSFGDLDIIVLKEDKNYVQIVQDIFSPNEIVKNGNVISFDYNSFQIDLILMDSENYNSALVYYSYNDLGNLMGRIAHRIGVQYGHVGLKYKHRDESNNIVLETIILKDSRRIFELLDYDYDVFLKGFVTLTDIFDFVVSSKFFRCDIFALNNRNKVSRARDKKRLTYIAFLEYCGGLPTDVGTSKTSKKDFSSYIFEYCPSLPQKIKETELKLKLKRILRKKFNGNIVSKITNLSGAKLGKIIYYLRNTDNFDYFIFTSTKEEIELFIKESNSKYFT